MLRPRAGKLSSTLTPSTLMISMRQSTSSKLLHCWCFRDMAERWSAQLSTQHT